MGKVLTNHLKRVLLSTILAEQGAFVAGRRILDQALVVNEAVKDYRVKKKEWLLLKIKFEKAYDHVDWNFLYKVLERKGFSYKWRMWMWGCIRIIFFLSMGALEVRCKCREV